MSHHSHILNTMANEQISNGLEESVKDLLHDYAIVVEENVQLTAELDFLQDQNRRLEEERNKMKEQLTVISETVARVL